MLDSFAKLAFKTGSLIRNPSLRFWTKFLKASDQWPLEKLQSYQAESLKTLVQHAVKSKFYQNLFQTSNFDPESFALDDFFKLPTLSKTQLLDFNETVHVPIKGKRFFCETSGTSGQVLTFLRNENWDSANRATIFRGLDWYGVQPWEFNIYFWGYNFNRRKALKVHFFDRLQNRVRLFSYSPETLKTLLQRSSSTVYISGYSSMIYELARLINQLPHPPSWPKLKMIKGTSEKIFPHYQEEVFQAFGSPIVSEYGSAESGIIAFECPFGSMHINMEGVLVEQDPEGQIIVTNLHSWSFPIIRYKLGDHIQLSSQTGCECGRAHPIIKEVTGRTGCLIFGKSNCYPSLTFYNVFKNLYFEESLRLNYQVHQWGKGSVEVWLREKLSSEHEALIRNELHKYFGSDLDFTLKHQPNFHTFKGKLKDVVSHINGS